MLSTYSLLPRLVSTWGCKSQALLIDFSRCLIPTQTDLSTHFTLPAMRETLPSHSDWPVSHSGHFWRNQETNTHREAYGSWGQGTKLPRASLSQSPSFCCPFWLIEETQLWCHKKNKYWGVPTVGQWVKNPTAMAWVTVEAWLQCPVQSSWLKDLTMPKLWFSPWSGNCHMPQAAIKEKKKSIDLCLRLLAHSS